MDIPELGVVGTSNVVKITSPEYVNVLFTSTP